MLAAVSGAVISGIKYPVSPAADSGTIRIHLLGHAIGSERYVTRSDGDARVLTDTFAFTDRGGRVQLVSELRHGRSFESLHLRSVGRTYRFVNVDADMEVPKGVFAVASYAPLEIQALLVRYWETHGRPKTIAIAPGDSTAKATIEFLGEARVAGTAGALLLRRYSINGVAWGREILYLDRDSQFVAIVTRANLLPLEGVREDLASANPALLDSIQADAARTELAAAATLTASVPVIADKAFALVGARIVAGTTGAPIEDGVVIVGDGRIVAVGPRQTVAIPAGTRTIDARGKTVIPGLWDMHAHVALPEWGPAYLGVGVTTARDMCEPRAQVARKSATYSPATCTPRRAIFSVMIEWRIARHEIK